MNTFIVRLKLPTGQPEQSDVAVLKHTTTPCSTLIEHYVGIIAGVPPELIRFDIRKERILPGDVIVLLLKPYGFRPAGETLPCSQEFAGELIAAGRAAHLGRQYSA